MARAVALICALLWTLPASAADIATYFKQYYLQQVREKPYLGVLEFLRDGTDPLASGVSHKVIIDRANGYLQVADNTAQDQALTMAVYRRTDGKELLVVGSSNCADACGLSVELFAPVGDRLQPVDPGDILPTIDPARFIKRGQTGPGNVPKMNYVPARIGTGLTVKPWYGYEVEFQMSDKMRAALQDVVLSWDPATGRFH
jgi:hypothetical protein